MDENQDSFPDVYHLTLDIAFKMEAFFSPIINLPRLIYLEPEFTVNEFTFGYKFDLAKFWIYPSRDDLLCFSSMAKLSEIESTATLVMRFQECYKTIIDCIYKSDNFAGNEAKYFEQCSQSSKTTITMVERNRDEQTFGVIGSDDDDVLRTGGTECKPGATFLPLAIGDIQSTYINHFWHYMASRSGKSGSTQLIDVENLKPVY